MLRVAGLEDIQKYMDFCYALSQDSFVSSFPTYTDGIKTRADFEKMAYRGIADDRSEILLFEQNTGEQHTVLGWIQYYWIPEDLYIGFETFIIQRNIPEAIDEFLAYAKKRFVGYQISFGFPAENVAAVSHLKSLGFERTEESDVLVLHFDSYEPIEEDNRVVEVVGSNWPAFKQLHDQVEGMYWNSNRLFRALEGKTRNRWKMYLYYEAGKALGNIYFVYTGLMAEIFGIDFRDNIFHAAVMEKLLIRALNQSKADGQKHMTFFTSGEESDVAKALGFKFIAEYQLFQGDL